MTVISELVKQITGGEKTVIGRPVPGYLTRIRDRIKLTSPEGEVFEAKWKSNDKDRKKHVGIFNYAQVNGTVAQDLGITSETYPMSIFFDGENHDLDAERFNNAISQRGQWDVIHPIDGFLGLQLIKSTQRQQVVNSTSATEFVLEWIEPIDPETLKTTAQLAAEAVELLNDFNAAVAEEFENKVRSESLSERLAISDTVNKITTSIESTLGPLSEATNEIRSTFLELQRGIQDVLRASIFDPLALAAQMQQLIQLPALAVRDIKSRLSAYSAMNDSVIASASDSKTRSVGGKQTAGNNVSAVKELALASSIGAVAVVSTTGQTAAQEQIVNPGSATKSVAIKTQSQILETIVSVSDQFTLITNELDDEQRKTEDKEIDIQYFSQTESFNLGLTLTNVGIRFLLDNFFNLRIEKRFVLNKPSTPARLTIENYGDLGENDSNLDLFIDSNNLQDAELILLPIGTEVVIYA